MRRDKAGGVGVAGLGGVLPGIDTQFLHARDESRAVDSHAGRDPIGSTNTAIALGEGPHDLFALLLGILVGGPLPIQRCGYRFYNNLEQRGDCQTPRKSHKDTRIVGWKIRAQRLLP